MKKLLKILRLLSEFFGFYPSVFLTNLGGLMWYFRDRKALKEQVKGNSNFPFGAPLPILNEKTALSGSMSGHYFHQDLLVAQRIFANQPKRHVDIGSRTDGFVTHVASFREIEVFDIRPSDAQIRNIHFVQADFMNLDDRLVNYTDSLSCLHVIEHFGLGRYGDPIDADGHLKGLENMYRVLQPGGKFYFSTPIGPQRINFNAHRVFSVAYLLDLFTGKYHIDGFSYVDDKGDLHRDIDPLQGRNNSFSCQFGCGIFEMTKLAEK